MRNMRPPSVPVPPVPVLDDAQLKALLATCKGSSFADRRDLAILLVFIDTGARRSEVAGLRVDDIDADRGVLRVTGKGRARSSSWLACGNGPGTRHRQPSSCPPHPTQLASQSSFKCWYGDPVWNARFR